MNVYEQGIEALRKWSERKIKGKTALMHKRIADVSAMYAEEVTAVIRDVEDTAAKFGVSPDNADGMAHVLRLVLGSRQIDTSEPAELPFEGNGDGTDGQVGTGATRQDQGCSGADGAARDSTGESPGGIAVGRGQNEPVAPTRSRRQRNQARQP